MQNVKCKMQNAKCKMQNYANKNSKFKTKIFARRKSTFIVHYAL